MGLFHFIYLFILHQNWLRLFVFIENSFTKPEIRQQELKNHSSYPNNLIRSLHINARSYTSTVQFNFSEGNNLMYIVEKLNISIIKCLFFISIPALVC